MSTPKLFYLIVCIFLGLFSVKIQAQNAASHWNPEQYRELNEENFRKFPAFLQNIDPVNPNYALLNACLFFLTNEFRTKNKKKILIYSPQLETAAWHHSKAMAESDFFGHLNPKDPSRETTELRAGLAGILNPNMAENIAMRNQVAKNSTYLDLAESIFSQWINSEGQKSNILSDKALQLGCGVFMDHKRWFATQCFQNNQLIKITQSKDVLPMYK